MKAVALGEDPPFSTIVDYYFNKAAPYAEDAIRSQIKARMPTEIRDRLVSVCTRIFINIFNYHKSQYHDDRID